MKTELGENAFETYELSKYAKVEKEFVISQKMVDMADAEWERRIEEQDRHYTTVSFHLDQDDPRVTEAYEKLQRLQTKDPDLCMKNNDLPEEKAKELKIVEKLKGQLFINEDDFTKAVNETLNDNKAYFQKHKDQLLKDADKKEVRISDSTLKKMVESKIPKDIRGKLKHLQDQPFDNKVEFEQAVKNAIGDENFQQYQATLQKVTEKQFSITEKSLKEMEDPKVPDDIRNKLGDLNGRSFDNEAMFSKAATDEGVDFDSAGHQDIKTQVLTAAKVSASERKRRKSRRAHAPKKSLKQRRIKLGK